MDLKSVLMDIIKHTSGLGIIENIKISSDENGTTLAAMDSNRTVIMNARLHDVVPEFEGDFGMGNLGLLSSLMKLSNYQGDGAEISVQRQERNGSEIPTTLVFSDGESNRDQYRFMSKEIVDQAMKVATFKGANWNVELQPETRRVNQLVEVAGIYSGIDPAFVVKTEGTDLVFEVGSPEGGVVGRRVFANNVEGKMGTPWKWPLSTFLGILKLGGTTVVKFSDGGACQIDVDSGIGVYTYVLPAMSA